MKITRTSFALAISALALSLTAGCRAQIPVSPTPTADVSWTAPTGGCGTAGASCTYVVLRTTATGATCPDNTGTAYTQVGTTPAGVLTYTDSAVPTGAKVCWIIQAQTASTPVLTGPPSGPSNSGNPLQIPSVPLAPGAPNATATADNVVPARPGVIVPDKVLAANDVAPLQVVAKLRR